MSQSRHTVATTVSDDAPSVPSSMPALPRLQHLTASAQVLVLVYYRGVWDPFCKAWARSLAHMRSLPGRLDALRAHLVFVSSQPTRYEGEAAQEFHFGPNHPAVRAGCIHFVNDEALELVHFANTVLHSDISVLQCDPNFTGGYLYRNGIVQPSVVAVAAPWSPSSMEVIANQSYRQGDGGPNGDVVDRPPACSVFRGIERVVLGSTPFVV